MKLGNITRTRTRSSLRPRSLTSGKIMDCHKIGVFAKDPSTHDEDFVY